VRVFVMKLRRRFYSILEVAEEGDRLSRAFDLFIVSLITLNVFALIIATVPTLAGYAKAFRVFELASVIVFSVEYTLRIWSCTEDESHSRPLKGRLRFASRGIMVIDLLAILPFYVALAVPAAAVLDLRFLRAVRLMRIFRLFKLGRYSRAMKVLGRVLRDKKEELGIAVFMVLVLLILASSLMYFAENPAQPKAFPSIPAAMWWGVATLTTVGYGDVVPVTALGKVLGAIVSLLGIGLFALPAGILASGFASEVHRAKSDLTRCPHCGKDIQDASRGL
jgi:voltage-gated potassium channel